VRAVHIGLGGNVGDPVATLRDALERIARLPGVELDAVSSAYESAPVGLTDQPAFINAAARLATGLTLRALLDGLLAVEQELGLAERRFALEPLVEIDPGLSLPDGRLLSALLEAVRDQAVRRLDGVQLR